MLKSALLSVLIRKTTATASSNILDGSIIPTIVGTADSCCSADKITDGYFGFYDENFAF
jgi:hypothetical protein